MIDRFRKHIDTNFSFLKEKRVLLAISGGVDSVVLAYLLEQLQIDFALAHVNFQLRGADSDADEHFVKQLAKQLSRPIYTINFDTKSYASSKGISIQMAARELRYTWFNELLKKGYDYVLTAHHADDDMETFFINLSRSTGLEGLTGIPKQNNKIIRPLLAFSRKDILLFAKENQITWREDKSNSDTKYLRNKIRYELLPRLTAVFPQFETAFKNTQNYLQDSQTLIEDYLKLIKPLFWKEENGIVSISIEKIKAIPHHEMVLYELLKDYGFTNGDEVKVLLDAQSGKQLLSPKYRLLKDRFFLILVVIEKTKGKVQFVDEAGSFVIGTKQYVLETVSQVSNDDLRETKWTFIDKSKLKFPLSVRKWKNGDYFYPLGMTGKKKVSDFLIDLKLSLYEKENIYLLCDAEHNVVWVIDKRLDNRFKITTETTEIIRVT